MGGKKCRLPAGRDQNIVLSCANAALRLNAAGHGRAQTLGARHSSIARVTAPCGPAHCGQNIHMGANVMLPDGQLNDRMALFFQSARLVKNIPAIGSIAG